jgi:hypothetical protein
MQVKLARYKSASEALLVAIKDSRTGSPSWITAEAKMHACLLHPRIVSLVALIPSEQDSAHLSGIVTAYCAGGSLGEWLSKRRGEIAAKRASDALGLPLPQLLPGAQQLRIALHMLVALARSKDVPPGSQTRKLRDAQRPP